MIIFFYNSWTQQLSDFVTNAKTFAAYMCWLVGQAENFLHTCHNDFIYLFVYTVQQHQCLSETLAQVFAFHRCLMDCLIPFIYPSIHFINQPYDFHIYVLAINLISSLCVFEMFNKITFNRKTLKFCENCIHYNVIFI